MSDVVVLVQADVREERVVAAGARAGEFFRGAPSVIAVSVGGQLRHLAHEVADGDELVAVTVGSDEGPRIMRHSAAHVLAQAVQRLLPEARLGIGPPVENGFYYDFDVDVPFVPRISRRSRPRCGRSSRPAGASSAARFPPPRRARNWRQSPTRSN